MPSTNLRRGYLLGISAYLVWGLFPLYFKTLGQFPAAEVIVHRVLWSALGGALLLLLWRHPNWWRELRQNPKRFAVLTLSGALIATNWLIYVWSVNNDRMLDASLGYYINPLVNVVLGMLFLGERLRPMQWLAVAMATVGVAMQVVSLGSLPWISLSLALSFGCYGIIRKQAPVQALPGLVVETWLLLPLALGWLLLNPTAHSLQGEFWTSREVLWLALSGPITLLPLLCFNAATKYLPFTTIGFLQYLTPSLILLQAVTLYGEQLEPTKWLAFICIWIGLAIYSVDIWRTLHRSR